MDGRGGCCIARYSGGGGAGRVYGYDMSKMDRIMLRFRPIAPRPVAGGDVSGSGARIEKSERHARGGGRGKRRYARDGAANKRCNNNNKRRKASPDHDLHHDDQKRSGAVVSDHDDQTVVTLLPLLPETPEPKEEMSPVSPPPSTWLSFDQRSSSFLHRSPDPTAVVVPPPPPPPQRTVRVVGSSVTVECVTDTWTDGNALGRTDKERGMNLERDTCPGFTSDGIGRVTWTNLAYRELVGQRTGAHLNETIINSNSTEMIMMNNNNNNIMVWLVMKERLPAAVTLMYPAFTCRVRLQCYVDGREVMKSSLTVPCDVWRMDAGGFAWRLDVNAALCLGR